MLLAIDLYEDFIDVEGVAVAPVLSLQAAGINSAKLDTPEAYCFATDIDASFGEQIFDITVAQIEAIVEPNGIRNDIWRESVAFICIHETILAISGS